MAQDKRKADYLHKINCCSLGERMIFLKIHADAIDPSRIIISICDSDLIGKKFEEGKRQLNVSERFYKGEIKTEYEITEILKNAPNINIIGKQSIALALKLNIIVKENIIKIQGIPHAQSIFL